MVWSLGISSPYMYNIGSRTLDGDFGKVNALDETKDGGLVIGGMRSGRTVSTEFVPTKMEWGNARYKIPDFDDSYSINISERAKAIFESFEPDIHQFVPADYFSKSKHFIETRYFLVVRNRIDSLDHTATTYAFVEHAFGAFWIPVGHLISMGKPEQIPSHLAHETKSKLFFNKAQIGDKHMWIDKYLLHSAILISDELASALTSAGLTGLVLTQFDTV